jgi:hypothetical protein
MAKRKVKTSATKPKVARKKSTVRSRLKSAKADSFRTVIKETNSAFHKFIGKDTARAEAKKVAKKKAAKKKTLRKVKKAKHQ